MPRRPAPRGVRHAGPPGRFGGAGAMTASRASFLVTTKYAWTTPYWTGRTRRDAVPASTGLAEQVDRGVADGGNGARAADGAGHEYLRRLGREALDDSAWPRPRSSATGCRSRRCARRTSSLGSSPTSVGAKPLARRVYRPVSTACVAMARPLGADSTAAPAASRQQLSGSPQTSRPTKHQRRRFSRRHRSNGSLPD